MKGGGCVALRRLPVVQETPPGRVARPAKRRLAMQFEGDLSGQSVNVTGKTGSAGICRDVYHCPESPQSSVTTRRPLLSSARSAAQSALGRG